MKQRYGIHLATRIQSDDPGKQANWADIDDDDEDWAPETIEWTDGTTITLPHADDVPEPSPEPAPAVIAREIPAVEPAKPKSPAPPQPTASSIVKPAIFGGRTGLVLKAATEKPTLVAKPPGPPTPVKSPWAPLPPVEKVAPVVNEIPQQPPQPRFTQRDPHAFSGMPPPAKEIAADDFSRTWREGGNTSRELYNSQSGRYEPVNDTRRGSMRSGDVRSHQPAVLQRPMHHDGPAEPSAAFQTHRATGHDGGFNNRRRTSSNVSGGSGNFGRRMSRSHDMPPPHEMLNVRRGSLAAVSDTPSSPQNISSAEQQSNQRGPHHQTGQKSPAISHPSPQTAIAQPAAPISALAEIRNQPPPTVYEDPIEVQKKVMRQTREQAIKRRQEEEAREEAAKQERIRIKLEAMGPAPESKKNKKELSKEEKPVQIQIQAREPSKSADNENKQPVPEVAAPLAEDDAAEPKVDSVPEVVSAPISKPVVIEKKVSPVLQESQTNGFHPQRDQGNQPQDARSSQSSQSWQNNSNQTRQPWAPVAPQQIQSRNVWGPPSNDRALGNGAFSVPEVQPSSRPGPIGPPNRGNGQFQQGRGRELYGNRPNPIGPPGRLDSAQIAANKAATAQSGWGSISEQLKKDDSLSAREHEQEMARKRELKERGILPEPIAPVIEEKWRQVALNEDGTRGQIKDIIKAIHGVPQNQDDQNERPEEATTRGVFEDENAYRRQDVGAPQANRTSTARGSRFFPKNSDVRLEEQLNLFTRPGSPSPPPPCMAGHPAYDGDVARPMVSLPRPPPVVRLPPPSVPAPAPALAPIGPTVKLSFAAAVQKPVVPVETQTTRQANRQSKFQDVRRQEPNWQEKINSLVGRRNSPPKFHALAVDSASKHALEHANQQIGATVSLPMPDIEQPEISKEPFESKPAAEECFEEQEMGSLPNVKVPNIAPAAAWNLSPFQKTTHRKFANSQITSADSLAFGQQIINNNSIISIKVPGQEEATTVSIPITRQRSNPRRGGARGGARGVSSNYRGGRARDASGGYPSPNNETASQSSGPGSNSRGRGRGRGHSAFGSSDWSRSSPTAVRT